MRSFVIDNPPAIAAFTHCRCAGAEYTIYLDRSHAAVDNTSPANFTDRICVWRQNPLSYRILCSVESYLHRLLSKLVCLAPINAGRPNLGHGTRLRFRQPYTRFIPGELFA